MHYHLKLCHICLCFRVVNLLAFDLLGIPGFIRRAVVDNSADDGAGADAAWAVQHPEEAQTVGNRIPVLVRLQADGNVRFKELDANPD